MSGIFDPSIFDSAIFDTGEDEGGGPTGFIPRGSSADVAVPDTATATITVPRPSAEVE